MTCVWIVESWQPHDCVRRESVHRSARSAHLAAMRLRYAYAVENRDTRLRYGWEPYDYTVIVTRVPVEAPQEVT